ncbi:MAG: hypothetical protein ABIA93_04655 [Candidatus Woesearchaeota archaeon]
MSTNRLILALVLLSALFLSSCSQVAPVSNYFIGTDGVQVSLLDNAPPELVYTGSVIPVTVIAHNLGAHDVSGSNLGFFRVSYDPYYLKPATQSGAGSDLQLNIEEQRYFFAKAVLDRKAAEAERNMALANSEISTLADLISKTTDATEILKLRGKISSLQDYIAENQNALKDATEEFAGIEEYAKNIRPTLKDIKDVAEWLFKNNYVVSSESGGNTAISIFELDGKSKFRPAGDKNTFTLANLEIKPVAGQRESPTTTVSVTACYPYVTNLSTTVCIDTDPYKTGGRVQACSAEDIELPDGQGAPLTVSLIEPEMYPISGRMVKPQFKITVENTGGGTAVNLTNKSYEICTFEQIPRNAFDVVSVDAYLLNQKLVCTPSIVRLTDGIGEVRCTVDEATLQSTQAVEQQGEETAQKLVFSMDAPSFSTVLRVQISYVYFSTINRNIQIKRSE